MISGVSPTVFKRMPGQYNQSNMLYAFSKLPYEENHCERLELG